MHAGAAQRVDTHANLGITNDIHIQNGAEFLHIVLYEVMRVRRCGAPRLFERNSFDAGAAGLEQLIRPVLDPFGDVAVRRTAVRRVVLESTAIRRIVRGCNDDTVGQTYGAAAVVIENGVRNGGSRCVFVTRRDHELDAVGGKHFERAGKGGRRQGVCIKAHEQRAIDVLLLAVFADGLADGQNMRFVESDVKRASAMARRAEGNPLRWDGRIGTLAVVRGNQPRNIDQRRRGSGLAGERVHSGVQVVASAALFSWMRCMSSAHDLTNDAAPSTCSWVASALTSIPARAKRPNTSSASPPSLGITPLGLLPPAAMANRVFSGIVSTVSGAASASTYNPAAAFGSLVPVLAHSMRCLRAPLASRSFQRLPAINSQCAR